MAQYVFVKFRDPTASGDALSRLENICRLLTPQSIHGACSSSVAEWPGVPGSYYAIQNSDGIAGPEAGALVIGWITPTAEGQEPQPPGVESDGSYAVIKANAGVMSFLTDQFGSRTLWYYLDEQMLVVSTSQRAIVRFKQRFVPNQAAVAWFLSSGCQGPFISWDEQIKQVRPSFEYVLDTTTWLLELKHKAGMELPPTGSQRPREYRSLFEARVTETLSRIIRSRAPGEVLLPLSGGLDSRLLFALSRQAGVDGDVRLVNWGVPSKNGVFDDRVAAHRVAAFHGKTLLEGQLPLETEDHGFVLDRFMEASEGRIDHFNAYTDGFAMWANFVRTGCRYIVRGDIPFTEGLDIDDASARAHIGLVPFSDYDNLHAFPLDGYSALQNDFDIRRQSGESLIRWRDRMYVEWRIPMVISAFSSIIGGFVENRCPMMSWTLLSQYMALPDRAKGNKKHIEAIWRIHDRTGVPSHAVGTLLPPSAFFSNASGHRFLVDYLSALRREGHFAPALLDALLAQLALESGHTADPVPSGFLQTARAWLSDRAPAKLKGHIKAMRPQRLHPRVLAYRLVLADKALQMYGTDAVGGHDRSEVSA